MNAIKKQSGTWLWGLLCLSVLAPFFFISYGFSNHHAASLSLVPSIVFPWEQHIPIWPWTIVPYWSIDLFYGLSLLLCWNHFELKQHVLRLVTAQFISVGFFLLFPLKFSFDRPELSGFFALWFDVLMGFDQPYNQAPSLHIVLLVILWDFYRRHTPKPFQLLVHIWSFLIAISVLTTWQHHFVDIPTGILVGALCLWLFPMVGKAPYQGQKQQKRTVKHIKIASLYGATALVLGSLAFYWCGSALWLFYPAISCLLVAIAYVTVRPYFFQKYSNGHMSAAAYILFAPYFLCAWLNTRLWTFSKPDDSLIIQTEQYSIYLGRIPTQAHAQYYNALFDCCAELPVHSPPYYQQYLSLDLIPLQVEQLQHAVLALEQLIQSLPSKTARQNILIFCALGYSRSTAILCAWLIKQGLAHDALDALQLVQQTRPWVRLNPAQLIHIEQYQASQRDLD